MAVSFLEGGVRGAVPVNVGTLAEVPVVSAVVSVETPCVASMSD